MQSVNIHPSTFCQHFLWELEGHRGAGAHCSCLGVRAWGGHTLEKSTGLLLNRRENHPFALAHTPSEDNIWVLNACVAKVPGEDANSTQKHCETQNR